MFTRQAVCSLLFLFLFGLWACSPSLAPDAPETPIPTPALFFPTSTATRLPPLSAPAAASTTSCLSQPGELRQGEVPTDGRPTAFIVYLPPCYWESPEARYPVLYLLHGQTFTADQWVRLGAPEAVDELIQSGESAPFIMVFPEDRYWNLQQGLRFGEYLLDDVIPYIEANFRVLSDRGYRALGGLSRGGGWAFQIGLAHPDLFGSLGLHSPAIFSSDRAGLERRIRALPPDLWPRLYFDTGDSDHELEFNLRLEEMLTRYEIPHEWHLNAGAHDEAYWSAHVEEYLRWYAEGWDIMQ